MFRQFRSSKNNDANLVSRVLSGEEEAFGLLVQRHGGAAYALACAHVGPSDAEDIVQEAFLRAFHKLTALDEWPKFRSWFLTIVRRLCTDVQRSRAQVTDDLATHQEDIVEQDPAQAELRELVLARIGELEPTSREVLLLHYYGGASTRQIAEDLDLTREAVKKRLQRAREALGRRLAHDLDDLLGPARDLDKRRASVLTALGLSAAATSKTVHAATSTASSAWVVGAAIMAVVALVAGTFLIQDRAREELVTDLETSIIAPVVQSVQAAVLVTNETPPPEDQNQVSAVTASNDPEPKVDSSEATAISVEPEEEDPAPTSSISGYVVDEQGTAVGGASVVVVFSNELDPEGRLNPQQALGRPENQYRTLTDAQGRFKVAGIRHEEWARIFVEADGMFGANGTTVNAGDSIEDMEIMLSAGIQLLGRILSPQGEPVHGAYISLRGSTPKFGEDQQQNFTVSDESGYFQLVFSRPCLTYLQVHSAAGDALFEAIPAGRDGIIDLKLDKPAIIFGEVFSSDGKPALGMHVHVDSPGWLKYSAGAKPIVQGTGLTYDAVTDDTGTYKIAGVFPDPRYQIVVRTDSKQEISTKRKLGDLSAGQTLQQDFKLEPMIRVTGLVVSKTDGKPVHGIGVALVSGSDPKPFPDPALSTIVDYDGRFDMQLMVDPGSYVLTPYYEHTSVTMATEAFGQTVELDHGLTSETKLTLDAPFSVTMRVVDHEGYPVPNVYIGPSWKYADGMLASAANWTPDAEGYFSRDGFAPYGTYTLDAGARGYLFAKTTPFSGRPGETIPLGTMVLYRAAGIQGVATDEDGNPLANANLILYVYSDNGEFEPVEFRTKRDGSFSTKDQLPATTARIEARVHRTSLTWNSGVVEFLPDSILDFGEIVMKETGTKE